jgi:hypothetical protein
VNLERNAWTNTATLHTRACGITLLRRWSNNLDRAIWRSLNGLIAKIDGNLVITSSFWYVFARVGSIAVVNARGLGGIRPRDADVELVTTSGEVVTKVVNSLNGEGAVVVGGTALKTWTISVTLRRISGSHLSEAFSLLSFTLTTSIVRIIVTEVRNVSHARQLVRVVHHVTGVQDARDLILLFSGFHSFVSVIQSISRERIWVWKYARLEGISQSGQYFSICPIVSEVVGAQAIGLDLFSNPLQQFPFGGTFISTLLDLIAKNKSPDQTKDEFQVPALNVFRSHVHKAEAFIPDEFKSST